MKDKITHMIEYLKVRKRYYKYCKYFKKLLRLQHIPNVPAPGEEEYMTFWKQLTPHVEPYSYRFFRHYCGDSKFIVPEDIGHSYIETALNPIRFTSIYEDKNVLPVLLDSGTVPHTLLCRINGCDILDDNHQICAIRRDATAENLFARIGGGQNYIEAFYG